MQLSSLHPAFDRLQQDYGEPSLSAIYGAGCVKAPRVCFVFMNPTGRNVAADPRWTGLRAPWIGTKNVWKLLYQAGCISGEVFFETQDRTMQDWDPDFATKAYQSLADHGVYVTNLAKATQVDARPLPNQVFREYRDLFFRELTLLRPARIVTFGNQVSSIVLDEPIKVSTDRSRAFSIDISGKEIPVLATYYPVGQGMRNLGSAVSDIVSFLD